ncbi:MAG: hypothetical protein P2A85_25795 [Microcoleus anatoxicus]|uniref:hypothetical protein n=1 Tax=Microcoleus anatoxicus TaxID=2705319 RepID=UPI003671195A
MKTEIKIVFLTVAAMVGGWANLALAIPVANQQGDYPVPPPRQRGNRQVKPIRENSTTLKPLE